MLSIASSQRLAERIYAEEGEAGTADEAIASVMRVHQKLAGAISPVVGSAGFHAMVSRSVQKSKPANPCLAAVVGSESDEFLEELEACLKHEDVAVIRPLGVAVLGEFLRLLSTFIGDELALRLVAPAWPESVAQAIGSVEKS